MCLYAVDGLQLDLWTFELSIAEDDIVMSQEVEVIDNEFRWNNVPTFVNG